jgi:hypothetical protein
MITDETPYASLPECVRQYYTEQEYLWLSDERKARIEQDETEPEAEQ